MKQLFKTAPTISFWCECYHYVKTTTVTRDSKGKKRKSTSTSKVVTHSETFEFKYFSTRDVSGLFLLDTKNAGSKSYIQLHTKATVDFADSISCSDYMASKTEFWERNRFRDACMDFVETRKVPNLNEYELIQISPEGSMCVSKFFFFIFTFLTLGKIYECYFNCLCHVQEYKIRKLVSTRYNLLQESFQEKYSQLSPSIKLPNQEFTYKTEDCGEAFESYEAKEPTEEELEKAQGFDSYVPNFKVTDVQSVGDEGLQAGVVQDDPGFESYDYSSPPPGFENYSGDVELEQNEFGSYQPNNRNQEFNSGNANNNNNQGNADLNGDQPFVYGRV
jgi:hypothetical protein